MHRMMGTKVALEMNQKTVGHGSASGAWCRQEGLYVGEGHQLRKERLGGESRGKEAEEWCRVLGTPSLFRPLHAWLG